MATKTIARLHQYLTNLSVTSRLGLSILPTSLTNPTIPLRRLTAPLGTNKSSSPSSSVRLPTKLSYAADVAREMESTRFPIEDFFFRRGWRRGRAEEWKLWDSLPWVKVLKLGMFPWLCRNRSSEAAERVINHPFFKPYKRSKKSCAGHAREERAQATVKKTGWKL